jgi:hypothetical protein
MALLQVLRVAAPAAVLALAAAACEPETTPEARAANVARLQCGDPRVPGVEERVLRETRVLQVEPMTFRAGADVRSDGIVRVQGVKLYVRPPEGISTDEMTRVLQCHGARSLLAHVDPSQLAGDPYVLPDAWVDIDVVTENGFVVVKESADRIWQNLALLHRATAFAEEHREAPR